MLIASQTLSETSSRLLHHHTVRHHYTFTSLKLGLQRKWRYRKSRWTHNIFLPWGCRLELWRGLSINWFLCYFHNQILDSGISFCMVMTKFSFDVLWHFLCTRCNGYTPTGRYFEFGSDVSSAPDVEVILQVTAIPIAELLGISSSLALSRRDVGLPCRVSCCSSLINQCRQIHATETSTR
jgi:hypothetical protein